MQNYSEQLWGVSRKSCQENHDRKSCQERKRKTLIFGQHHIPGPEQEIGSIPVKLESSGSNQGNSPSCLQIGTVDRGGSFLGSVTTKGPKPINLGLALLSSGLAKLHPSFDPSRVAGGGDLVAAEQRAREKRLKVYSPPLICPQSLYCNKRMWMENWSFSKGTWWPRFRIPGRSAWPYLTTKACR